MNLDQFHAMYGPPPPAGPGQLKFTIVETCDRIKEEFNFLQTQYHALKLECEKLASEKTEMQRHYVMYYEMSYGLNVEMHKQVSMILIILCLHRLWSPLKYSVTEIAKRLNAIIVQVLPFLSQEQQMHAQAGIPHGAHAPTLPMAPHPSLAGMPGLPPSSGAPPGLLSAVSQASLMGLPSHPISMLGKPDVGRQDEKRERAENERHQALLEERASSTCLF
ncbi:Amino-terminal enhancer of split [Armadillidium nasatum]|uniref:Amino-terminal enhancer of split n=1 Tax=Armadillidium nasatum TaxID=96803 RepID=A0A5N5T714_9CRUS|nr:Amino-terminal enhancer of split [Armadillidium nasatum]